MILPLSKKEKEFNGCLIRILRNINIGFCDLKAVCSLKFFKNNHAIDCYRKVPMMTCEVHLWALSIEFQIFWIYRSIVQQPLLSKLILTMDGP